MLEAVKSVKKSLRYVSAKFTVLISSILQDADYVLINNFVLRTVPELDAGGAIVVDEGFVST